MDLQSYNRYSYVVNNPLRFTDPTGETFLEYMEGVADGWLQANGSTLLQNVAYGTNDGDRGRAVGNGLALVQGIKEAEFGGGAMIGGGGATVLSGGTLAEVGVPVAVGGAIVATHGSLVTLNALDHLRSNSERLNGNSVKTG
jgi:hypothetical protein